MAQNDQKLKGAVREIGIVRDSDRHDSFNITIGIAIKTEGRVTYEEAERLSNKFRREYLGKDVEFIAVNIPCPVCGKILNSESGLKKHITINHPEKAAQYNSSKGKVKAEKPNSRSTINESIPKKRRNSPRSTRIEEKSRKNKPKKAKSLKKDELIKPIKNQLKKKTVLSSTSETRIKKKDMLKAKQLTLA